MFAQSVITQHYTVYRMHVSLYLATEALCMFAQSVITQHYTVHRMHVSLYLATEALCMFTLSVITHYTVHSTYYVLVRDRGFNSFVIGISPWHANHATTLELSQPTEVHSTETKHPRFNGSGHELALRA